MEAREGGSAPTSEGWFVLNAADAQWMTGVFGSYTRFEGQARFPLVGINIGVLEPGQPSCYYHAEDEQENFLVLSGSCLLLVEGQERRLKQWDFVHCPAWTEHVFVGAGDGPCAVLMVGARPDTEVIYPVAEVARRYGAGVERETPSPDEAYAAFPDSVRVRPEARGLPWET